MKKPLANVSASEEIGDCADDAREFDESMKILLDQCALQLVRPKDENLVCRIEEHVHVVRLRMRKASELKK